MNIQIKSMLASFAITIVLGIIIIPILKKLKVGQIVRTDGPQEHLKKTGTPVMGGLIMLIAILGVSGVIAFKYPNILPITFAILGCGFIGFIDDFLKLVMKNPKGLSPNLKLLGLIIVSVTFVMYLVNTIGTDTYIPIIKQYITIPNWIYIPSAVFIILACTNTLNLTDGVDGLASGVTCIIMVFFTVVATIYGNKEMSAFSATVVGSTIGFLFFNIYPAKVFMGDTGSLALRRSIWKCSISLENTTYINSSCRYLRSRSNIRYTSNSIL